jgi:hypothetical protein
MHHRRCAVVLCALLASPVAAQLVSEGDFSTWVPNFGAGGDAATSTVTREATGGNPDARLNITNHGGCCLFVFGRAHDPDQVSMSLEGLPFTLSLDVLDGPGSFGQGQAISLLVEQGGILYSRALAITGTGHATFQTVQFPSAFVASQFSRLDGSAGNPNFDGTVATRFGFLAANSGSGDLTMYYDNYLLALVAVTPTVTPTTTLTPGPSSTPQATVSGPARPPGIPTLGGGALLALVALLALLGIRRLREG